MFIFTLMQPVPTEDQYKQMVLDKTGGLFRLAVGLMESCSPPQNSPPLDFTKLLNLLGLYFQIRDDLLNVSRYVPSHPQHIHTCALYVSTVPK